MTSWRTAALLTVAHLLRGLARCSAFAGTHLVDIADALEARA